MSTAETWENNIHYFILKAFFPLNRGEDKLFGLYWCLCVPSSFIILSADCKKRCSGVCDRREIELSCNSACTLGKHKEVDIDGVVTVCSSEG